jgi:hypothetical protein
MKDEAAKLRQEIARMRRLISEFEDDELLARIARLIKELQRRLDEIKARGPDEAG